MLPDSVTGRASDKYNLLGGLCAPNGIIEEQQAGNGNRKHERAKYRRSMKTGPSHTLPLGFNGLATPQGHVPRYSPEIWHITERRSEKQSLAKIAVQPTAYNRIAFIRWVIRGKTPGADATPLAVSPRPPQHGVGPGVP